jgi:hypothetical protein
MRPSETQKRLCVARKGRQIGFVVRLFAHEHFPAILDDSAPGRVLRKTYALFQQRFD